MGRNIEMIGNFFECLADSAKKPELFQRGETLFWDDQHISKSMLKAHLDFESDGASRKMETIEKTVEHLISTSLLHQGEKLLDLGCGPGLYSNRFCQKGLVVTGIDISRRSIEYARKKAEKCGLVVDYICKSFFDVGYDKTFDSVLQIYGELCTFSDEERNRLLAIIHKALKKGGLFIFDVSTRTLRMRGGLINKWYFSEGGFWRQNRHVVLEQGFDYPENDTWLNQYTVIDEDGHIKLYRIWFHDYSLKTITHVLHDNGFRVEHVWNNLTGDRYIAGSDWIAIAAKKV
jgi:SAM-dependent methyltransferase